MKTKSTPQPRKAMSPFFNSTAAVNVFAVYYDPAFGIQIKYHPISFIVSDYGRMTS
jgi:hypothetical protein